MNIEELNEKISLLENELEKIKQERDQLSEPRFERKAGNTYYFIYEDEARFGCFSAIDNGSNSVLLNYELARYKNNNYFHSPERANEVLKKINMLLKLERLYDTYCPDYTPDWDDDVCKYGVAYEHHKFIATYAREVEEPCAVYFPTREIAEKVRDLLNAEQEGE